MTVKEVTDNGSSGSCVHDNCAASIITINQSMRQLKPGDIAWIKTRDSCWWPGQVVDEGSVRFRPKKKIKDGVVVRMYGCYEYLYLDALTSNTEFENILKQHSLSIKEAFQKAMNEDLSRVRSRGKSLKKVVESRAETPDRKKQKQGKVVTIAAEDSPHNLNGSTLGESTPNLSERRKRVMQNLGLIAPMGSPYR